MRAPKLVRHAGGVVAIVAAGWLEDVGEALGELGVRMAELSEWLMPTHELLGDFWPKDDDDPWADPWEEVDGA